VEQPPVRLVPVPLAGHVTHVLQSADLLLDEHPIPGRFRGRSAQRSRVRPVLGRLPAGPTAPVAPLQQPQRTQPGGRPAPDQHDVVVRVGQVAAQVVQWAARGVRPEPPELARGNALSAAGTAHATSRSSAVAGHPEKRRCRGAVSAENHTLLTSTPRRWSATHENRTLYNIYVGPFGTLGGTWQTYYPGGERVHNFTTVTPKSDELLMSCYTFLNHHFS